MDAPLLSDVRYFLEVSRTLNLTRAAERLGIQQSSVSVAMQRLEQSLGAQLLVRSKAGVRLTKAGELFAVSCRELIEGWERLKASTQRATARVEGHYTLGCHPNPGRYLLPRFLAELHRDHPRLHLQLVHDRSQVLNEMVVSARLDFAIVSLVLPHPDLVSVLLARDHVGLWAHPKVQLDPEREVLMLDPEVKQSQDVLRLLSRRGIKFRRTMTSSSVEVIWALAEEGHGIAVMPGNPVRFSQPRSVLRPLDVPGVPAELRLIYHADAVRTAAAREIVRVIRARCTLR